MSPVEAIAPVALDGYFGEGFMRTPPGQGPFPAVVIIHGGFARQPIERVRGSVTGPYASRFLEAGYVVAAITYRGRDTDRFSPVSLVDSLAAVDYMRGLPFVDANSVVVNGCSGGGDLALQVAAATQVPAIVPEEPAAMIMAGLPASRQEGTADPDRALKLYRAAPDHEKFLGQVARITAPILIVQGDRPDAPLNRFNDQVLLPELRAAGRAVDVKTYPGAHCFATQGRTAAAVRAFEDIEAFFRKHIPTAPTPIDSALVQQLMLEEN